MATLSAAERRKYREKQKLKQGVSVGSTANLVIVVDPPQTELSSPAARSPPQVDTQVIAPETSGPRPPPSQEVPVAKKPRVGPKFEFVLLPREEATVDVAWKRVLKCQKRADAPVNAPVRSVFDSRYPLNRVLNASAGIGDVERVATLGIQQTLVAVKSYGHYVSVLAHLAEDAFNKTMVEHGRLEEGWKKADEELKACMAEKVRLNEDLQKWDREKVRLEGKVFDLTQEKEKLAVELEKVTKDLGEARGEVDRCNGVLKSVSDHFPDLAAGADLTEAVDDLKGAAAESFEKGFELALAQLKVLYPDADVSTFDCYKVIVDGQIVEEDDHVAVGTKETPAPATEPVLDLASVDAFLNNDEGLVEGDAGEDTVGHASFDPE